MTYRHKEFWKCMDTLKDKNELQAHMGIWSPPWKIYCDEYMFGNIFKDKNVLVTGNTGFKGSWLSQWLLKLEANVIGLSKDIPTNPLSL